MTDNETPEQTPAQRHYTAAEYALDLSKDADAVNQRALIAQAQVHATLAQAASNEALIQFILPGLADNIASSMLAQLRSIPGLGAL